MQKHNVKLVIFDLAGTVIDFGSRAPAGAFIELFRQEGITISEAQARGPMGMHKRDHIAAICAMPEVAAQTENAFTPEDVERLYRTFIPMQMDVLEKHGDLVPGAIETIETLRKADIKIAFTTGYSREMLDIVVRIAKQQGLYADTAVSGTDVPEGRPAPWMALECAKRLNVYPIHDCLKVGDTIVDIQAGRNAGMWSIGVSDSGNMAGYALADWQALDEQVKEDIRQEATRKMKKAGADRVIPTVADIPALIGL
jgi:phosphonoacetaldehyde hydrolase